MFSIMHLWMLMRDLRTGWLFLFFSNFSSGEDRLLMQVPWNLKFLTLSPVTPSTIAGAWSVCSFLMPTLTFFSFSLVDNDTRHTPHLGEFHLFPAAWLIPVCDRTHHCCVITKLSTTQQCTRKYTHPISLNHKVGLQHKQVSYSLVSEILCNSSECALCSEKATLTMTLDFFSPSSLWCLLLQNSCLHGP